MQLLAGIHAVREALRAGGALERVLLLRGASSPRLQEIVDLSRARGVPLRFETREALDRLSHGAVHQGVIAYQASGKYAGLDEIAKAAKLIVLLDGVEDPHNLGAILRTAYAAGAGAVVIPERRSAGLTETVAKAAAGALSVLPVVRAVNIKRAMEDLKKAGFWVYGLDERGPVAHTSAQWTVPTAIVLGGEGHGLHQQVREQCDFLVRIPMAGQIASLNVSVACGVVLFEWRRATGQPTG